MVIEIRLVDVYEGVNCLEEVQETVFNGNIIYLDVCDCYRCFSNSQNLIIPLRFVYFSLCKLYLNKIMLTLKLNNNKFK